MRKQLVYGLMALSLWAPAQARPELEVPLAAQEALAQADVLQFIVRSLSSANQQQVADMVKANPELARRTFDLVLKEMANPKTADKRDPQYFGLLWIWARALGEEALQQQLVAAQIPDQPMTFVDPNILPRSFARLLVAMGNFRQSELMLSVMEKNPGADADSLQLFMAKARMVGGRYLLARQQGESLVELARKQSNPDELLELYVCLLDAGRMGGFPEITNRYLEPFKAAIAAQPAEKRALWQFYAGSFDQLRQLERNPETSVEEFCRRHDGVWAELKSVNPFESPVLGRVFGHLSSLWLERMADFYAIRDIPEGSPEDERLGKSLVVEVGVVNEALAHAPKEQKDVQGYQAGMALLTLLNDAHEQALRVGQAKMARQILPEMATVEKGLVELEPQVRVQEKQATELLAGCMAGVSNDFAFNLLDGDWNRQRTRMRLAQLQQMLAESPKGKLDPAHLKQAQKLAAEAVTLNARSLNGAGYQGASDARWAVVEYQLNFQPPGWPKEAARLLGQLAQVNEQLGYREGMARVAMLQGRLQAAQGQKAAAIASLQQAVDSVEAYLTEVEAGEAGARKIRDRYKAAYTLLAKLQVSSGKADGAFQTVSRQLEAQAAQQNQDSLRENSQLRELSRVKADTAALERQLADERQQGKDTKASEQLLASSKGEYQRVVADLRRSHPQYEGAMAVRPVEFLELKRSIPADTTVVLYFVSEEGLYTFVASQKGELKIRKVEVSPKELEASVLRVRQLINLFPSDPVLAQKPGAFSWTDASSPGYQRQSLPLKTELVKLHKWLVAPIQADLGNRPVLAIVPTGLLHYVPFPALCTLDTAGRPKFLAESFQCVNLVKTSDLMPPAGSSPGKKLVAVGNPDGSLPGAEREVTSITASFPGSQKLVGKDATVARLKKLEPNTGYVHLATHGQLSEADPKNSYLVMAGSGESSHFRATDIYDLDWPGVRLVTLSACKTALQEGKPGAAITNLAEAFRVAGGHSVVASLWSVEDNATEKLMVEFYKGLAQGKSLGASLQNAELSLSKDPRYGHPFFWSAFTLFGDWR